MFSKTSEKIWGENEDLKKLFGITMNMTNSHFLKAAGIPNVKIG